DAAREREGVHHVRIHDVELPLEIRARRLARDLIAERRHVLTDDGILNQRQLLLDLRRLLLPELDFLLLRHTAGADSERHRYTKGRKPGRLTSMLHFRSSSL